MDKKKNELTSAESTVFSKPAEHNDRPTGEKRKKTIKLIAILLGLLLLAGVVYSVIELVPEKDAGQLEEKKTDISCDELEIDLVEYTVGDENLIFRKIETPDYNLSGISWLIDDLDEYKQEKNINNNFVGAVCGLEGVKMEDAADSVYGLDYPASVIKVKGESVDYTITVGKKTADDRYVKLSGDKSGVYRIDSNTAGKFTLKKIDFASRVAYSIVKFETDVSAYKNAGGALERFDFLTYRNKDFSKELVFVMNDDALTAAHSEYLLATAEGFYTQNADKLMSIFTDTLYISGAYSFFDDEQSLAAFGLDDPDVQITLSVGGEQKWFKFKKIDEEYCAVVSDDRHVITKVKIEDIPFWSIGENNFLYSGLIPFGVSDIVSFSASGEDATAEIAVSVSENGDVTVTSSGKGITEFEDFLSQLTALSPAFGSYDTGAQSPCAVFSFTLKNGAMQTLDFYMTEGAKYVVKSGDVAGKISATAYSRMIRKLNSLTN